MTTRTLFPPSAERQPRQHPPTDSYQTSTAVLAPPPPLRKHGRGPKCQVKTAVQRPSRAQTRPCMRATHVRAKHARASQSMVQCTSNP